MSGSHSLPPSRYSVDGNQQQPGYSGASQPGYAASHAPGPLAHVDQSINFGSIVDNSNPQRSSIHNGRSYDFAAQPRAGGRTSSSRARDAYGSRVPDSRRRPQQVPDWPGAHSRDTPAVSSPAIHNAERYTAQESSQWTSPEGPDRSPDFEHDQTFYSLQARDGTKLNTSISADAYKGIAKPLDGSPPFTYRRNYLHLRASFALSPMPSDASAIFLQEGSRGLLPIRAWGLRLTAQPKKASPAEQPRNAKKVGLVQFTAKRDKGDKDEVMITEVTPTQPTQYPHSQGYYAPRGISGYHPSAMAAAPLRQYRPDTGELTSDIVSTTRTPSGDSLTFERMQFSCATGNNRQAGGSQNRGQQQQYFQIVVELYADIETNPTARPRWIKVCQSVSEGLIVRGRSPHHYKTHDQGARRASENQIQGPLIMALPAGRAPHTNATMGYSYSVAEPQPSHNVPVQFSLPQIQMRPPHLSQEFAPPAHYTAMDAHASHNASGQYHAQGTAPQSLASSAQQMDGHIHHAGNYSFTSFSEPAYTHDMLPNIARAETGHMSHHINFVPRAAYNAPGNYSVMPSNMQHAHLTGQQMNHYDDHRAGSDALSNTFPPGSYGEQPDDRQVMIRHNHHMDNQLSGGPVAPAMPTPPIEDRGAGAYGYNPAPLSQDTPSSRAEQALHVSSTLAPIVSARPADVAESSLGHYEYFKDADKQQGLHGVDANQASPVK